MAGRVSASQPSIASRKRCVGLKIASIRPAVIPSVAVDLTVDLVTAARAGFANETLTGICRRIVQELGIILRATFPQRMNPAALVNALDQCLKNDRSGVIVQLGCVRARRDIRLR